MEGYWDFFPDHARFTITKAAEPYGFLYEGTPGGQLDLDKDFFITPDGARHNVTDRFSQHLASPRWVFFGKEGIDRGLFLGDRGENSPDVTDEFGLVEGKIAEWGFGCRGVPPERLIKQVPGQMTTAFLEPADRSMLSEAVNSVFGDMEVRIASVEERPKAPPPQPSP